MHLGDAHAGTGLVMTMQPVISYALNESRVKYPDLFRNYTYFTADDDNSAHCGPDAVQSSVGHMASFVGKGHIRSDSLTVFIAPLCGDAFNVVGDFARELDFFVAPCMTMADIKKPGERFPTMVSFASADIRPFGYAVLALLEHYAWLSAAIITDQPPGTRSTAQRLCGIPLEVLPAVRAQLNLLQIETDSRVENFTRALTEASNFTRIIMSCDGVASQRKLLADAAKLEMTRGNFVFIYVYSFWSPLVWSLGDAIDESVQDALNSQIIVSPPPADPDVFQNLYTGVRERRRAMYNVDPPNTTTGFDVPCYEAVSTVALVLNESCSTNGVDCQGGRSVVRKMLDKTFRLPLRPVTIDAEGQPITVIYIQKRNELSNQGVFKTIFYYNSFTKVFRKSNDTVVYWIGGLVPYHRPPCGLKNELCLSATPSHSGETLTITLCVLSVSTVLLIVVSRLLLIRERRKNLSFWCQLCEGDLDLGRRITRQSFRAKILRTSFAGNYLL
ncbi:hypothetical protein BV898_08370 [Hypsibius exemplaris]|uniref:Receptor ligand binding region domain-containing protein n=1 Tax=Hypsibius exemplaris TaxID=2072580 RepID=A0A1W0WQX3_HYPEX|nr:hypothetical protein BV898_08370 [Hypsibius exemplaris]